MSTRRTALLVATLIWLLVLAGCGGDDSGSDAESTAEPTPSTSLFTLTPLPVPEEPPPSGKLIADMRQSSRDAALNRFQVWIDNDTTAAVTPTAITYRDGRFRAPLPGTRLREIPAQSERGYPIYQPDLPDCSSDAVSGTVTVEYDGGQVTVPVEDETDVVGRYTSARCLELEVAEVATLRWADEVPADRDGEGSVGTLTLVVETTGEPRPELRIDTISGTPVLSPVGSDVWRPDVTITGDQPSRRIDLPLKPTRCDAHAFAESGGATAFKIGLRLGGEPGQITLRMGAQGAANAIAFARASCGMLETVTGGEG